MANKKDFIASGPTNPDLPKSKHDLSFTNNFTAQFGKIYPVGSWYMPANSYFKCNVDYGFDLQPLVFPVQTNMRMHIKFYSAPLRILWKNYKNWFSREGKGYDLPYISRDFNFYKKGSLSDYIGLPSFKTAPRTIKRVVKTYGIGSSENASSSSSDIMFYAEGITNRGSYLTTQIFSKIFSHFGYLNPPNTFYLRHSTGISNLTLSGNLIVSLVRPIDSGDGQAVTPGYEFLPDSTRYYARLITKTLTKTNSSPSGLTYRVGQAEAVGELFERFVWFKFDDVFSAQELADLENAHADLQNACLMVQWTDSSFGTSFVEDISSTSISAGSATTKENGYDIAPTTAVTSSAIARRSRFVYASYDYTVMKSEENAIHFMSVNGELPLIPIRPWRHRMYEFIYNYFFRNERVTPFMLPDGNGVPQQVYNQYLTNDGDGADSTTPVDFFNAPYEYDMFTTCIKSPTFGDAPLVGVSFNYDDSGDTPQGEFQLVREGQTSVERFGVKLDADGRFTGITAYNTDADSPDLRNLRDLIDFGFSINDLRNVSAYQRFKERMIKAGPKYANLHYEFFGTNPPIGEEFPSYLGGYTDMIYTNKVLNTSSQGAAKLGEYAGNAFLRSGKREERRTIKHFCSENSYIMAVCWFSVTPTYSQKLDKDFVYSDFLDFYNPQFNNISPQPVFDYQIAPLEIDPSDPDALKHVFGYNRPFADLVSKQDEVHGEFRDSMSNFIFQRVFGGVPKLNEQFLNIDEKDLTQIFAVTDTSDKIFGQIHFDADRTDTIPHTAIPRII